MTSKEEREELLRKEVINKFKDYDYVRFSFADLGGVARGKIVTARTAHKFLNGGLGMYSGGCAYGCQGELPEKVLQGITDLGHPNVNMIPDLTTLHVIAWSDVKSKRTAGLLCNTHWLDGTPQDVCPRFAAQKMLTRLDDMGYSLLSAFEIEFKVHRKEGKEPLFSGLDFCVMATAAQHEAFLYEVEDSLHSAGVSIETFHTEYSPGQFEYTMEPQKGIIMADQHFLFKNCVRDICNQKGYLANFMSKPYIFGSGSGAHFNFSIWDKESGANVLHDKGSENKLSQFSLHFIAGLIKHAPALTALVCPTVNCYRRVHSPWAPDVASWGIQDRTATIRVKNDSPSSTYFENRLPSGACNPYLVIAATLAAGLDGVKNKLNCPPPRNKEAPLIPTSLQEALEALRTDSAMVEALGENLVKWYIGCRIEIDLVNLADSDMTTDNPQHFEKERKQYEQFI